MANLTNAKIANTFKDLLQVNAATSNSGLDDTVRQVQDGGGTAGPFGFSNEVHLYLFGTRDIFLFLVARVHTCNII